jgi:hypothetical protein
VKKTLKLTNLEKLAHLRVACINNNLLPLVIAGLGILLRIVYYFSDRSLWLDEAALTLAIINTPWDNIYIPIYNGLPNSAPVGYAVLLKTVIFLGGTSEIALRFVSIVFGTATVCLFWRYLEENFNRKVSLTALLYFSLNPQLVYYSAEVKFYSIDVFSIILLLLLFSRFEKLTNARNAIVFTAFAMVLQWFSYVTIIVSVGMIAAAIFSKIVIEKKANPDAILFGIGCMLMIHFFCYKFMFIDPINRTSHLYDFWVNAFAPFPKSMNSLSWYINFIQHFMENPLGFLHIVFFSFIALLIGFYSCFKSNKIFFKSLFGIFLTSYCVSLFKMYPVYERLGLFLVPVVLIVIAMGLGYLLNKNKWGRVCGILLFFILLIVPLCDALHNVFSPFRPENMKPLVKRIMTTSNLNECVYVYYGAVPAFEYYAKRYKLTNYIIPVCKDRTKFDNDIKKVVTECASSYSKVWILFTHVHSDSINDEELILKKLSEYGKRIEYFHEFAGATLYKYEMSNTPIP